MIKKDKLMELIEQGKTFWIVDYDEYDECNEIIEINKEEKPLIKHFSNNPNFPLIFKSNSYTETLTNSSFSKFYETKEDAEFACKYQNIRRVEYLKLPIYEDFIKKYQTLGETLIEDEKCVMFTSAAETYSLYATDNEVWVGKDSSGERVFNDELTKENYEKACEVCRKLFLGE